MMEDEQIQQPPLDTPPPPEEVQATEVQPEEPTEDEHNIKESQSDPWMSLIAFGVSIYLFKLWFQDLKDAKRGEPFAKAFPGNFTCSRALIKIAVIGSLAILLVEVIGEYAIGSYKDQSDITVIALLGWIAAAFYEELIFRGLGGNSISRSGHQDNVLRYMGWPLPKPKKKKEDDEEAEDDEEVEEEPPAVIDPKTESFVRLLPGVILFSLMFMMMHPYLWEWEVAEGRMFFQFWEDDTIWTFYFDDIGKWWSTLILFANSIFWFWLRYNIRNETRSIIPCIAGHLASNIGVFVVKLMQGHVVAFWDV